MKINNERGVAFVMVGLLMFTVGALYLKTAEFLDHTVINKKMWEEKHMKEMLKVDAGVSGHDANALPAGYRVDTNFTTKVRENK